MAPLHHHFEMKAWSETRIMVRFWIVAAILCACAFVLYYRYFSEFATSPRPCARSTAQSLGRVHGQDVLVREHVGVGHPGRADQLGGRLGVVLVRRSSTSGPSSAQRAPGSCS